MNRRKVIPYALSLSIAAAVLAACGVPRQAQDDMPPTGAPVAMPYSASGVPSRALTGAGSQKITHIVFVVQEQRSFDNLFCGYSGADAVKCSPRSKAISLEANCTLSDTFQDFERARKTGDFSHERTDCPGYTRPEYRTVPPGETKPYRAIAASYVLGDRMFSSTGNPTFESHQYDIAAQSDGVDQPFGRTPPDGCVYRAKVRQFKGPPQPACDTFKTLATELTAAGLTWAYYAAGASEPTWDAFGWIRGSSAGTSPPTRFLTDVANGQLSAVTWVTPELRDSDRSGSRSATGPAWVASVVNAVGESRFWDSTAIFVIWSGYGGWADHVRPPLLGREGLGFRVPLLVISPYTKPSHVSHVQYETTSILRFAEDLYGLPQLTEADSRARSPAGDCFNFSQKPRPFVPIEAP
ncbi:MAG TPA: alkaline phosphatase family protein [Candidatus Cybelea sp.]|nr:alkaline phosphatase family protein [Candidatus Cybelea sp.]